MKNKWKIRFLIINFFNYQNKKNQKKNNMLHLIIILEHF